MKKFLCILGVLCFGSFGVTAEGWGESIIVGWDYPIHGLVQFDVTTGAFTTILSAPYVQIEALAYDSDDGILYGVINGVNSLLTFPYRDFKKYGCGFPMIPRESALFSSSCKPVSLWSCTLSGHREGICPSGVMVCPLRVAPERHSGAYDMAKSH